ncbi:MAG: hypothetical protein JWQ71_2604 [Pedosphaera sp.]|nr:hypothetical protein [Pedosphaera sp.]
MKKIVIPVFFSLVAISSYALPDYDPFSDATSGSGTSYTVGSNLIGQTNAAGVGWTQAGPNSAVQPTIQAGDLTISGLASSGGNQSVKFGGNGTSARFNLSSIVGSGTIYYSFALKLTSIAGLSSSGVFWSGFNNSAGTQLTTPTTVVTRIVTRTGPGGTFNLGLDKSSGIVGSFVWDSNNFAPTTDTIFIVGSYTFNSGSTTDDVSQMWVNPNSADFGAANAPAGGLTSTAGNDISLNQIASFVFFDRNAAEPAGIVADDLRIGTSWADVTPAVPEPTTWVLTAVGLAGLFLRRIIRR